MKPLITPRIDAITNISQSYRGTVLPCPKSVKIELTSLCDLKCFFCATSKRLRNKGHMDWEFYKKTVYEMRDDGVEELGVFFLGESMIYPKIADAIFYAKKVCGYPYVYMTTNGVRAEKHLVKELAKCGLDSLKFSFNFCNKEQFIENTGVDGFDAVKKNIMEAKEVRDDVFEETGHRMGIFASSVKFDGEQEAKMKDLIDEILPFVDEHYYLPLYGQAGLTAGVKGTKPVAGNVGRLGCLRESLPCWSVFTEGHITWDGLLSACCFDHNHAFTMADLNKTQFMDGWNSEEFQKLRAAHLAREIKNTACNTCIALGEYQRAQSNG